MTSRAPVITLIEQGLAPVPVEPRGKAGVPGWDKLTVTVDNVTQHFDERRNVGVRLGAASGGLCDVDLDCVEAVHLASKLLPATSMCSGRRGNPRSHWFYRSDLHETEDRASIDFQDVDGKMLCQLRFGGNGMAALTVVPPSVHPSGERVEWCEIEKPSHQAGFELKSAVAKLAAAALLARHWPVEGGRHRGALAVDGFLTRLDWSEDDRKHFIEAIAETAGDDQPRDRSRVADKTEQKLSKDGKVPGYPALVEAFGKEVASRVAEWLKYPGWKNEAILEKMNAEYCVIIDGAKTRVLRFDPQAQTRDGKVVHRRMVPNFLTFGDFCNYHLNEHVAFETGDSKSKLMPVGAWWARHPGRRTYRGVAFRPDAGEVVDRRLNLWRGWGVEPAAGDWSLMRQHIKDVIADGNEEAETYILNWLAWAVQHPAERAQVALVLKGGRGTGKGTVGNAMCHLFGQHATHISSADHLAGRFNAHLRDACLLFADEAYWPGDKGAEGTLKRLITEPTLFIEAKGRDGVTVENMLHVLMASNSDWVVPAGEHERRYAVFQVAEDKRQDEAWFGPLYTQLEEGGYAAMLHDLLHRDLGDWHPRRVLMTQALHEQQLHSLEPLDAWVVDFFNAGVLPAGDGVDRPDRALSRSQADFDGRNPRNGLFDLARDRVPGLRYVDDQVLAACLKKWGCTPWRSSDKRGWQFPPLKACRARWEEKYPGWPWQHDVADWQAGDNKEPNY